MNKFSSLLIVAAGLAAAPAFADCTYPKAPTPVPDGNTASLEEMVAANKAVKAYNVEIESYLGCIQKDHDTKVAQGGDTLSEDQKKQMAAMLAQKNNAAVDELQAVAAKVNEQIRIYKARQPAK